MGYMKFLAGAAALFLAHAVYGQNPPQTLLLKDYDPVSLYKIAATEVDKAKFPAIDMHSHAYAQSDAEIKQWIEITDRAGVQKTVILTELAGPEFDEVYRKFAKYPDRFEVWCGLLFAGYDKPGYTEAAVKELVRCRRLGAKGVASCTIKAKAWRSEKRLRSECIPMIRA